ncbi:MAG: AhpC/TSA family protein [Candidatus Hydrogenedentes bacterium]|nr:AhpC/TSA family protein [Candidatus Hydrogenedentota bacterium]
MRRSVFAAAVALLLALAGGAQAQADPEGKEPESGQAGAIAPTPEEIKALKAGDRAPDVPLTNIKGKPRTLAKVLEGKPTVIVFYRGGWCPFCNKHLAELGQAQTELQALGYQVVAISPDGTEAAAKTKEKLAYRIFSDSTLAAAKAFGVAFKMDPEVRKQYLEYIKEPRSHDFSVLPVPSVFIVNKEGEIRYVYTNADYKVRLGKEDLLKAAKEAL